MCLLLGHFFSGSSVLSHFWVTICKTVCPMLSDHCPICLSVCLCLSFCNVGVLWSNGWKDQDGTWYVGWPRPRPHCVRWGPSSPKKGHSPPPQFVAHVCGQTTGWIKMPLGMEVGLGPGHIVLDGIKPPGTAPNFRPMSVVAKRLDGLRCHLVWR